MIESHVLSCASHRKSQKVVVVCGESDFDLIFQQLPKPFPTFPFSTPNPIQPNPTTIVICANNSNLGVAVFECRPLSRYSCSTEVRPNTEIKHTIGKNKPSLVSVPIIRVTDQSSVKCHHFKNCNFYKDLYGDRARHARSAHLPYKTL